MLSESDRARYTEVFAPYLKGHAGHYVYRLKNSEVPTHLEQIGHLMQRLLVELAAGYQAEPTYKVLARVFAEHFRVLNDQVAVKANQELSAASLQSPDDLEASYREKRGEGYQGYVVNVTETCDPENPLQLITKVQTAPNTTDDSQLLAEALPNLAERTELDTIYTDGGHGGPTSDQALAQAEVEHIQTAIRGREPAADRLGLADFDLQLDKVGQPATITCPTNQTIRVKLSPKAKAFVAHFDPALCAACPLLAKCPAQPGKRDPRPQLRFTLPEAHLAARRRRSRQHQQTAGNLRAAVEATVRSLKHPYPDAKLPVRGLFRVASIMLGSAALTNVRRIQRYRLECRLEAEKTNPKSADAEKYTPNWPRQAGWVAVVCALWHRFVHFHPLGVAASAF
jgi:hypothetical protein